MSQFDESAFWADLIGELPKSVAPDELTVRKMQVLTKSAYATAEDMIKQLVKDGKLVEAGTRLSENGRRVRVWKKVEPSV